MSHPRGSPGSRYVGHVGQDVVRASPTHAQYGSPLFSCRSMLQVVCYSVISFPNDGMAPSRKRGRLSESVEQGTHLTPSAAGEALTNPASENAMDNRHWSFGCRVAANLGGRFMAAMVNKKYSMEKCIDKETGKETGEMIEVETLIHTGLRFVTATTQGGSGVCVKLLPAAPLQNGKEMGFVCGTKKNNRQWVLKVTKNPDHAAALLESPCDDDLMFPTEKKAKAFISEHGEERGFCEEPLLLTATLWLVGKRDNAWLVEHCLAADANCKMVLVHGKIDVYGKSAKRAYLRQTRDIKVGERLRFNYSRRHTSFGKALGTLPQPIKRKGRGGNAVRAGVGRPSKSEGGRKRAAPFKSPKQFKAAALAV